MRPANGSASVLKTKTRDGLVVVVFALDAIAFACRLVEADLRMLVGMREAIGDKGEQAGGSDVVQRGDHQYGENLFGDDGFAHAGNQVLNRDRAFAEKFIHQFVIAFGDHLDEFFVRFFCFVSERGGNFLDRRLAFAIGLVHVRFHADEIDDAAEAALGADRQLQSDDVAAEHLLKRFHRALKAGKFAVHPGEDERARNVVLGAVIPNFFRGDLRADVSIDGDQRGIGADEGGFRFVDESGVAGEIDEIDFNFVAGAEGARPFGVGEAGLNRNFSADFFFVPVGGGGAFRNFSPTRSHSRSEEQRRHELRFACAAVAYNAHVSDVLGEIRLHADLLFCDPASRPGSSGEVRPDGLKARACA